MSGNWIDIRSAHGGTFGAYLARPAKGSGPGLVLLQEIFGVTEDIQGIADSLAEEGYVVAAPDIFWRSEPRLALRDEGGDLKRAMALGQGLDDAQAIADIADVVATLKKLDFCKGRVAALGHCMGARLAIGAAAAGHVDCAVAYYPVGLKRVLQVGDDIPVPTVIHVGTEDPFMGPDDVTSLRKCFADNHEIEIYSYPEAGHAFANPGRKTYFKTAADMAYSRSLSVLRRVIGPWYDLNALWEAHRACEFEARDADETMMTMVDEPYVNHIPTLTGGYGKKRLRRFYANHFIPKNPVDIKGIPVSRTIGADRVVNEVILCFTHDSEMDWMLPGVPPTGKYVEIPFVSVIRFRGNKLYNEHIYWDQASVLVQIGLLDPRGLPVSGVSAAKKLLDPSLPSNELMPNWTECEDG
ncbi:dienelactone hydrolase family protein [Oceanibacterium hippocampi]|uniref:Carboxymethylenebutenolidase n=1 Tax=Oceanibacterium hippocampi TaxID=745714 RepID=A0A1Y5U188_9PROT|nr:dienelactone hydrolase family protein [Oceanibacterium hippocampi]SLN76568.1 Carboxymethylenebutenolidase [Oceanibacterium hippocampi]